MDLSLFESELIYLGGAIVAMFVIVDPFAVVPVYLSLTERFDKRERQRTLVKASMIATGILVAFAISGMKFFELFGITLPAFQIAGGVLLLLLGLEQLHANRRRVSVEEKIEGLERDDISVFPLAMPLLAGPGSISTVILYSTEAHSILRLASLTLAIIIALGLSLIVLQASPLLVKILRQTGLNLMTKIMGIVLTAMAVQFVINGIIATYKQLN